jgi:hypothetical protein
LRRHSAHSFATMAKLAKRTAANGVRFLAPGEGAPNALVAEVEVPLGGVLDGLKPTGVRVWRRKDDGQLFVTFPGRSYETAEGLKTREYPRAMDWRGETAKAYDEPEFVAGFRAARITPHVAQNTGKPSSAIDGRTTRHPGYAVSQRCRMRVEEIFGWLKTVAGRRKVKHRGRRLVDWLFRFGLGVYNLVRIRNLTAGLAG